PRVQAPPVRNALSGVWLGHRLHPMLTDVAVGAFSGAALVDLLAPRHSRIARRLIGVGLVAAVPTAASGLSDWIDVYDDARRVGIVHAAGNSVALGLYARSWLHRGRIHRARGKRGKGRLSSFAGLGVLAFTGYLGGHLSYVLGVGVNHTGFNPRIKEWLDVAASSEVPEGGHSVAKAGDVELLLVRQDGELIALANRCSHAGMPLDPGKFEGGCVTCPAHGSVFRLADGSVACGPAASPQPTYEVRESEGRVEVRS
ncbi:MAG: Rieske (2Fe-2S) protein, partial [Acidimicrobiales bacterium]